MLVKHTNNNLRRCNMTHTIRFQMKKIDDLNEMIQNDPTSFSFIDEKGEWSCSSDLTEQKYLYVEFGENHKYVIHPKAIEMFFYNISITDYAYYRLSSIFDSNFVGSGEPYEYKLSGNLFKKMIHRLHCKITVEQSELERSFEIGNNIDTTISNGYGNNSFYNYDNSGDDIYFDEIFRNTETYCVDNKVNKLIQLFEKMHSVLTGGNDNI